jgi:hypothetical protein
MATDDWVQIEWQGRLLLVDATRIDPLAIAKSKPGQIIPCRGNPSDTSIRTPYAIFTLHEAIRDLGPCEERTILQKWAEKKVARSFLLNVYNRVSSMEPSYGIAAWISARQIILDAHDRVENG